MIKIVVAEDQPLILKDLCHKIMKSDPQAEIVGTATDGQSAYEQVVSLRPDLLFTDIRMPFLTGLELLARLNSENISIHTVIISGFKDFEYAREAMKLGVDEYLLKPLSTDDISYVLEQIKKQIFMKKQDYTQHMMESLLLSSKYRTDHVNTAFPYQYYRILMITAGSYPTFTLNYSILHEDWDSLLPIAGLCGQFLKEDEAFYLCKGKNYNEVLCLLCLNQTSSEEVLAISQGLLDATKYDRLPVTVCLSRQIRHLDNIGMEVQIMRACTERSLLFGKSSILETKPLEITKPVTSPLLFPELLQKFRLYVKSNDTTKFLAGLLRLMDRLDKTGASQISVEYHMKRLFEQCFKEQSTVDFSLELDEFITNSKSYSDLYSYLQFFVRQIMEHDALSNTVNLTDSEKAVAQIQDYINQNFARNININEVATAFALTPAYFSRLFKKYTGIRPIDYLTSVRIKSACEYFSTTDYPVRQVAELCGYSDQFYFSKAFKTITGKSPSEYRISIQEPSG